MDSARYEEVQQWLNKSQRDLKVAWVLLNHEESLLDAVVYHCQQSAEKALKAYLTYQNVAFRKTHDLDILVDLCALSEPSFQDLKDSADSLTPYATEFRYPSDTIEPEIDEAEEALDIAGSILDFVIKVLPDNF
ncbi:HEPN domain-containing protein [Pseudanabaena sp. FACHB-1277]|jgi:HEPN domain-containing protein|uniref:HEPN domain-containing protein n=1 Tax=Pseudanabaena cinerea FACHB-1277 TaxID=2949581 RepID=A0A926Z460_9CYAN|nr:HEPN domain-containing protein [Pseudanabaena cinerea]MBD2148881.1 HEPN domain-containing protein [Pseudanabaena cinerea FACHB-1277]